MKLLRVAINLALSLSVNLICSDPVRSRFQWDWPRSGPPPPPLGPSNPSMKGRNWLYTASGLLKRFKPVPVQVRQPALGGALLLAVPFAPVTCWGGALPAGYDESSTAFVPR